MFDTILIANRGEIACRIIKTARSLGYKTVAVYSTADQNSLHVKMADDAYCIGDPKPQASYLNIPIILEAARTTNAQAIHPGYGFLSENSAFAKACEQAGITLIGPDAETMTIMGSKQLSKQHLSHTNIPLTPGYHGICQSNKTLSEEAKHIGFPILIKAAAGGGGRGMRRVDKPEKLLEAIDSARREAKSSFNDDRLILEKLVLNARHIEVQILADHHGHVLHLFERDCSLQRRHQKIIEEAPAPLLEDNLRSKITQAACDVARSVRYRGAGTVEFLLAPNGEFYFMEMNTRLQVEHPVTEMITGLDLVALQIQIAQGQPLALTQDDIHYQGHAFECRIYAEDPDHDFMPATGTLHYLKMPEDKDIRIDSGVTIGSHISIYYDPMIAKLVTYGATRDDAIRRMQYALNKVIIGGVKTNISFLKAICQHPEFIHDKITTDFLEKNDLTLKKPDDFDAILATTAYDYLNAQTQTDPLFQRAFGWHMHLESCWFVRYTIAQKTWTLKIIPKDVSHFEVTHIPDSNADFSSDSIMSQTSPELLKATLLNNHLTLYHHEKKISAWIDNRSQTCDCYLPDGLLTVTRSIWANQKTVQAGHNEQLTAPMPSTVVAILKGIGDAVEQGEQLIVLEAMKMEHTLRAPRAGVIEALFCSVGTQVTEGAELVYIA